MSIRASPGFVAPGKRITAALRKKLHADGSPVIRTAEDEPGAEGETGEQLRQGGYASLASSM